MGGAGGGQFLLGDPDHLWHRALRQPGAPAPPLGDNSDASRALTFEASPPAARSAPCRCQPPSAGRCARWPSPRPPIRGLLPGAHCGGAGSSSELSVRGWHDLRPRQPAARRNRSASSHLNTLCYFTDGSLARVNWPARALASLATPIVPRSTRIRQPQGRCALAMT